MGLLGVKWNQLLAFLPLMMKTSVSESVFFPGCAFMKLDKKIIDGTHNLLKKYDKKIGLSTCCCAKPSKVLGEEYYNKKVNLLVKQLKEAKVRKVYVACPNCNINLREISEKYDLNLEVIPIYDIICKLVNKNEKYYLVDEEISIHDPCRMREYPETIENVRLILDTIGQKYCEPKHSKRNTSCCGNINMIHVINPEKSKIIRDIRFKDFIGKTVLSYCNGCLYSVSKTGLKGIHICELLFGKSNKNSAINRIKYILGSNIR